MKLVPLILGLFVSINQLLAQTAVPFDTLHWAFAGNVIAETFRGQACIRLTEGSVYLKDSTFENGIIEFDMTLSKNRYFPGFGFRVQDPDNFEQVYLRPHQLGNPDALQYTPVFKGQAAWQLYYGDGYSTAVSYPLEEWVHIQLIVRDDKAEVYIGDLTKPVLIISALKRVVSPGRISLTNEAKASTRFANFRYLKTDTATLMGAPKAHPSPASGTLLTWLISNPFAEKQLDDRYVIPAALKRRLSWQALRGDPSGLTNLSRVTPLDSVVNTVFAKVTLLSKKAQIKKFQFGFSDRVRVYLNQQLVYSGQDGFLSRDYRFLGTIGYFDALYLTLRKGKNELWLAVSDDYGGWGLEGVIGDRTGLLIKP